MRMACDDCRRQQAEDDVRELRRSNTVQGVILVSLTIVVLLALSRLNAKDVLTWGELLTEAVADG